LNSHFLKKAVCIVDKFFLEIFNTFFQENYKSLQVSYNKKLDRTTAKTMIRVCAVRPINKVKKMNLEEIRIKIAATQELINITDNQDKKNELIHQLKVLQMRLDMEKTHDDIKRITNRD
jgi:hypothetical protein